MYDGLIKAGTDKHSHGRIDERFGNGNLLIRHTWKSRVQAMGPVRKKESLGSSGGNFFRCFWKKLPRFLLRHAAISEGTHQSDQIVDLLIRQRVVLPANHLKLMLGHSQNMNSLL